MKKKIQTHCKRFPIFGEINTKSTHQMKQNIFCGKKKLTFIKLS